MNSSSIRHEDKYLTPEDCKNDARIVRSIFKGKYEERRKPLFVLVRKLRETFTDSQLEIVHFWVVKEGRGYQKGDIILSKDEALRVQENGGRLRDIYTYRKEVRKQLKEIAKVLDLECPWQHGFHAKRGVHTAWSEIKDRGNYRLLIDLKNAFCQITRGQLYMLLRKTFDLNKADSLWFSRMMCDHTGHMFQGNPITPAVFNLLSARIGKIIEANTALTVVQYADDLTICSHSPITPKERNKVRKLIKYTGWEVNMKKVHYRRSTQYTTTLGITQDTRGNIRAENVTRFKKVVRWLEHVRVKEKASAKTTSAEALSKKTAKDGKPILLKSVVNGMKAWLIGVKLISTNCYKSVIPRKSPKRRIKRLPLPLILQYELGNLQPKNAKAGKISQKF